MTHHAFMNLKLNYQHYEYSQGYLSKSNDFPENNQFKLLAVSTFMVKVFLFYSQNNLDKSQFMIEK